MKSVVVKVGWRKTVIVAAMTFIGGFAAGASAPPARQPAGQPQAPVVPPAQTQQGAPTPGQGRGGRGGPGAQLYAEHCVSCHGTDLAGGRYDSLFDQAWLAKMSDERMVASIRNGVPNTEMDGFKQALTELQVWQLVQYIRAQG